MCRLTGGGDSLWFGLANCLTHVSDNRVRLASGLLQLYKALVEMAEILDDHLPCCQAIGESNLSEIFCRIELGRP